MWCLPPPPPLGSSAQGEPPGQRLVALDAKQLLLRGATLQKTRWVVGMVVYAGLQTKLQMNDDDGGRGEKTTRVMEQMQRSAADGPPGQPRLSHRRGWLQL